MSSDVTVGEQAEVVKLLKAMRLAAQLGSYSEAARLGPMTRQWVSALEQEGQGDLGPVVYLLRLAKAHPDARSILGAALGANIQDMDDPELRLLVGQIVGVWNDPRKRGALRKGIEALFDMSSAREHDAAHAKAPGAGS